MARPSERAHEPSNHPGVAGREPELAALTDAVRRLILLTVTNIADRDETAAIALDLDAIADRLAAHVADPPLPRYMPSEPSPTAPIAGHMPFDVVIGPYNPLALPVRIESDPPRAIGHAHFTTAFEGPPGCVHGGVIAQVFDIVLSAANRIAEAAGPTARLDIRYRRPTLLHRDLTVEAEVVETIGRRTRTKGRIVQDGQTTVDAEGWFVALGRAEVLGLRDRHPAP